MFFIFPILICLTNLCLMSTKLIARLRVKNIMYLFFILYPRRIYSFLLNVLIVFFSKNNNHEMEKNKCIFILSTNRTRYFHDIIKKSEWLQCSHLQDKPFRRIFILVVHHSRLQSSKKNKFNSSIKRRISISLFQLFNYY